MHPLPIVLCLVAVVMVPAVIAARATNAQPPAPPGLRAAENSAKRGHYWSVARV